MSVPEGELRPALEEMGAQAQRALAARPSLSIRTRISLGFFLLFSLALGITIAAIVILSRIQNKLLFMESVTNYTFEIQQARRFEKNYFLYGTNLPDAISHVHQAGEILHRESGNIIAVVGDNYYQTMLRHLARYEELLNQLEDRERLRPSGDPRSDTEIEEELRQHGGEMVSVASQLVDQERRSVNTMLFMSQRIPIVFLLVLLLLVIYLANFIARQMLQPLGRLMEATRRIASGDFTPLTPHRRYRDEFSELAMALNHMMHQLTLRHDLLVQAHKLKAVGTLTAGVAHELNNPLNNIMLTAETIIEDYARLSDPERLDLAKDLVQEAERARKIVRNLLDFARESELHSELLSPNDLVEETLQLAYNQLKLAKVRLVYHPSKIPPVHGDRQQLNQVFLNLILNALDAMPTGGTLAVSTQTLKERSGDYVVIEFSDSGTGIPEHILPNIFDPFFTTKPVGKGTGLGLSVSLGIIQKHGGEIRVSSRLNHGSVFSILLPVAKIPAVIPPPSHALAD